MGKRDVQERRVYAEVAKELGLSPKFVEQVYKSFWRYIRESISALPLKEMEILSKEEFDKIVPYYVLPRLGRLYFSYYKFKGKKERYNDKIKESKAAVQ